MNAARASGPHRSRFHFSESNPNVKHNQILMASSITPSSASNAYTWTRIPIDYAMSTNRSTTKQSTAPRCACFSQNIADIHMTQLLASLKGMQEMLEEIHIPAPLILSQATNSFVKTTAMSLPKTTREFRQIKVGFMHYSKCYYD